MKDMLGNEIVVGNMVAYPVRHSSSMWMSYGKVAELNEGVPSPDPDKHWLAKPPYLKVKIRSRPWWSRDPALIKEKTVKVVALDRVLKIPSSHFNAEDRTFFKV